MATRQPLRTSPFIFAGQPLAVNHHSSAKLHLLAKCEKVNHRESYNGYFQVRAAFNQVVMLAMFDSMFAPECGGYTQLTVQIPGDIAARLATSEGDLARRALECFAVEELKAGRITEPELGRMLGLARIKIDGFLKPRGVYQDYTMEDFDKERAALKSLGL